MRTSCLETKDIEEVCIGPNPYAPTLLLLSPRFYLSYYFIYFILYTTGGQPIRLPGYLFELEYDFYRIFVTQCHNSIVRYSNPPL